MQINAKVDVTGLAAKLKSGEKNLVYATVQGINETAKKIQEAERQRLGQIFKIRKPSFIFQQAAIIKPFANVRQGRIYAEISVGQKPRLLLSKFEEGGVKTSEFGKNVAVPVTGTAVRPTAASAVPFKMFITKLGFVKTTTKPSYLRKKTKNGKWAYWPAEGTGGKTQLKGKYRTFIIRPETLNRDPGVWQRFGPKKGDIRMIYLFTRHPRLKSELKFVKTAISIADGWISEEITRAFLKGKK